MPEHQVAAEMLVRLDLHGYTVIADKGFAGEEFEQIMAGLGARFCDPTARTSAGATARSAPCASGSNRLLDLQRPTHPRTPRRSHPPRRRVRVALRMLALAAGLVHNQHIGDPGRHFAAYGH